MAHVIRFVACCILAGPFALCAADGARGEHWSLRPIIKPKPPKPQGQSWCVTPIDSFILSRLEANRLSPVPLADRRTLLRRVTYDLTGLPPTVAEMHDFLADRSPNAFDKVIDRLLASPAYGERWGRHWLDVARYADTAGDGADYPVREAAKYRNWVIDAFNRDLPFDEMVRRQIAGDILAKDRPAEQYADCVTATGFLAVGKRYGYSDNTQYQHLDFADAIDSVGRSILGLSIGCARCHDHKYDPISAKDYYALYGILQSSRFSFPGGEEQKRPANLVPLVPPQEAARLLKAQQEELARTDGEIASLRNQRLEAEGGAFAGGVDLDLEAQTAGKALNGAWLSIGSHVASADAQSPFRHLYAAGKLGVRMANGVPNDGVRYVFPVAVKSTPATKAIHFTIDFRNVAAGQGASPEKGTSRFYLGRGVVASQALEVSISAAEIVIKDGSAWKVIRQLEPGRWYNLSITINPKAKKYSGAVTPFAKPIAKGEATRFEGIALAPNWDGVIDTFICDAIGHVAGKRPTLDLDQVGLGESPFPEVGGIDALARVLKKATPTELKQFDERIAKASQMRQRLAETPPYPVAYGVSDSKPVDAQLQKRGEPDQLGDAVPRRFLSILGGDMVDAKSEGSGRKELAEWLTRPTNPLTARVFVNRVWQWHFGRGLVTTPSDFGVRGDKPSHPELLDYLAATFVESGWSIKELHRQILKSSVYQLSSADNAENVARDPENVWHWRFSRQPLTAEAIRDSLLVISGKLDRTVPKEHPFPPTEGWGYTIHQPFYAVYESNHRSVYLMVQRNRRHPFLALFDAADPNLTAEKRLPTITPTQSLFLMNSPFMHEQATAFADRLLADAKDDSDRIRLAIEMTQGREATAETISEGIAFMGRYEAALIANPKTASLAPDVRRRLAWSALARVFLSHNAFLNVD